ncbi:MAG: hypothetical protein K0V04_36040 [Deltaproteobacteria bacterium]|nr:hypothetical protein [Deltaproteobacteria bacterium]
MKGDRAQELIDAAVERVPFGEVQTEYVEAPDGTIQPVHSQEFEVFLADGTRALAGITCSHSGCSGENCGTSGCLPNSGGTGCTGASCGSGTGCVLQSPTCSHKATLSIAME